ncbi:APC amino acid permease [Amanita rubescens]|nr:APC amino acid permease [Amanita rubescens]KAF8347281.1 APC amino acid permease [Amanita rubescens]
MAAQNPLVATSNLGAAKGILGTDDELLASLGYKQELKRNFTPLEVFGIGFSAIGLVPSITSTLIFSIPYGGPSAMVWGWTTCGAFLTCMALSMAELGSAAPTSGGLYYWTFKFSSQKWRHFLAWIVAYCNTIGNISGVASIDWGCAVQITAAASIGSGLKFQATPAQTFGVYSAVLLSHALLCTLSPAVIARLQRLYIVLNVLLVFAIIIALPAATPSEFRNRAEYVFGNFTNQTSWPNGFAFILSFLTPLWTITGLDSAVHISEEARNANIAVPYGILFATLSSIVLGWGIIVALTFCMGTNLQNIVNSPIGQPMATILFNSFGQKGTLVIWAFIIILQFSMGSSIITAASRQIFAFSRDGGFPLSNWLYHVNHRVYSPVRCVWFAAVVALLLGLLAFAGPDAIGAIFLLSVISQYVAYIIPISARHLGGEKISPGPFHLGTFSLPVSVIAVLWMMLIFVVFLFPTIPNPGVQSMNYGVVVFGGILILAIVYFYCPKYGGKYWFKGPIRTYEAVDSQDDTISDEKAGL